MARDAVKAAASIIQNEYASRPQTRAFAASLQAFTYNKDSKPNTGEKREQLSDDDSSLSSAASESAFDIEDGFLTTSISKKRKRGYDTPSTTLTNVSLASTRTSPRKASALAEEQAPPGKAKKARRQPAKRIVNEAGKEEVQAPANWEKIYKVVTEMRKEKLAPVDTMGCETLAEDHLTPRVSYPCDSHCNALTKFVF